jgi:hypothetical protein
MKPADGGLWVLIASTANEPEVEEIARLIGTKRIKENEVRIKPVVFFRAWCLCSDSHHIPTLLY